MYLIFDCSALAGYTNYKANFTETEAWPSLIHISWILLNDEFKPVEDADYIPVPEGFVIDNKSKEKAHIDDEDVEKKSKNLTEILNLFDNAVGKAEYIFAHNLNYNENILGAEFVRIKKSITMFSKKRFCLMEEGTYYCKIPSKGGGFKFPTLPELHAACFGQSYSPSGNARADVIAAARSFIKLMKTRQLEDIFEED